MQGEEEVSIATNALELKTKNSKQFKIISGESEYVSSAHNTGLGELQKYHRRLRIQIQNNKGAQG